MTNFFVILGILYALIVILALRFWHMVKRMDMQATHLHREHLHTHPELEHEV